MSRFGIVKRIHVAAAELESISGNKPRFVYLGRKEWMDLAHQMQLAYKHEMSSVNNQVLGFTVFGVQARSHLAVSI